MFKRAFYQLKIVLISRFHGLINLSVVVIYTKEVCGIVDGWCEPQGDPTVGPQEGPAVRLARATAGTLGHGFLGQEHSRAGCQHALTANSGWTGSKRVPQTVLSKVNSA